MCLVCKNVTREQKKCQRQRLHSLQWPAVKWSEDGGTVKMNSVGGRQSKGGQAARQSPTSNNLSLYQSQHACPLPLPATKQFSKPTSKAVSLRPIMFVLRALICFSELSKCNTTCYRFVSLNHFRQRLIFLKSTFPALEMSQSPQHISWNGQQGWKKKLASGKEHTPWKNYKATKSLHKVSELDSYADEARSMGL